MGYKQVHEEGTVWCCLPLRFAVTIYGIWGVLMGVFALASIYTEDFREIVGGYTWGSRAWVTGLGLATLLFGLGSLLSVHDNSARFVRLYYYFLLARAVIEIGILKFDWSVLQNCEQLVLGSGQLGSSAGGGDVGYYNLALAKVVMEERCAQTRDLVLALALADIIFCLIAAYHCSLWCIVTDDHPTYTIALGTTAPVFTGYAYPSYDSLYDADERKERGQTGPNVQTWPDGQTVS